MKMSNLKVNFWIKFSENKFTMIYNIQVRLKKLKILQHFKRINVFI